MDAYIHVGMICSSLLIYRITKIFKSHTFICNNSCFECFCSKYEEIYPPEVGEFVYITDNTYTKKQVGVLFMLLFIWHYYQTLLTLEF